MDPAVAPGLHVHEGLLNLIPAESAILDASLVRTHALNHEMLVLLRKAFGSHWTVRKPPKDKCSPEDGEATIRNEDSLPRLQRAMFDQCETVCKETADDLLASVHHIPSLAVSDDHRNAEERLCLPVCYSRCLFLAFVPHAAHVDKTGLTDGFEDTEERADDYEAREIVAFCVKCQCHAPEHDVNAQIFSDWDALDNPVLRILHDEDGDVDACREPGIL